MKNFDQIVAEVFKISEADIRDDMSSNDIPEWDSMNYLFFIAEVEKRFGLSFSMDEVVNAKTLGDLREVVKLRTTIP